ncbi:MAG: hypothetical protein AB7F87_13360 [Oligoflexales bacterium]
MSGRSQTKDAEEQPCTMDGGQDNGDALAKAALAGCTTNVEKMLLAHNCSTAGRQIVAEKNRATGRVIDMFHCRVGNRPDSVFFSHPDEMIGQDKDTGVLNFYKMVGTSLVFKGNSFSADNPCRKCHVNGTMVMKELDNPWRNWIAAGDEVENRDLLGVDSNGEPRPLLRPNMLQIAVMDTFDMVTETKMKRVADRKAPFENETLKDFLKPLFCTTEITLKTSTDDQPGTQKEVPATALYYDDSFENITFDAGDFANHTVATGPSVDQMKSFFASQQIDARNNFLTIVPQRGDIDRQYLFHIQSTTFGAGYLERKVIYAAVSIDFPNPFFSKKRCAVWDKVPETPYHQLGNKEAVTEELISKMQGDDDPAVQAFVTYLKNSTTEESHKETVKSLAKRMVAFMNNCNKPDSAISDPSKVYRLFRSKLVPLLQEKPLKYFEHINQVEDFGSFENSPAGLFPEFRAVIDGKYADDEGLALNEDCQIEE